MILNWKNPRVVGYLAGVVLLALLPQLISSYHVMLFMGGLAFAVMALGHNLLLRYGGLLSFGHGAYFATGAYAVGLLSKYFPDYFSFELAMLSCLAISLVVSAVFGFVCVRHTRIFFSILTLALSMLLFAILEKAYEFTGGSDGIRIPIPSVLGQDFTGMRRVEFLCTHYYYVLCAVATLATVVMMAIVNSPFGKALQSTRDNEVRAAMIGIRVKRTRWWAFVISGMFTGLAGGLWSFTSGHITPEVAHWGFSGEVVYMVLLGGFMVFEGPIVGSIMFTYLKLYAIAETEYWMLIIGATLVLLVLLLPGGVTGGIAKLVSLLRGGGKKTTPAAATSN